MDQKAAPKSVEISVVEIEEIRERLRTSQKGTRIKYHTGFLCRDAEGNKKLGEIRKLVLDWASVGIVALVQRKLANDSYEYYAEVR